MDTGAKKDLARVQERRRRKVYGWLWILGAVAVGLAVGLAVEMSTVGTGEIEVHQAVQPAAQPSGSGTDTLSVAVVPTVSPRTSLHLYSGLSDWLAEELGRKTKLVLKNSYAEVDALLRAQQTDLAFVCTWGFVQGEADYDLKLVVAPVVHGQTRYRSHFIVAAANPTAALADLKGKRFAAADPLSNTGWRYPRDQLRRLKLDPDTHFGDVTFTGGHDLSVRAVADGFADGAAVDSLVYDQVVAADPAVARRVRIIHTSPEFGMPPVVAHRGVEPARFLELQNALLTMHESESGRAALSRLGIDRFVLPEPESYQSVREMYQRQRGGAAP